MNDSDRYNATGPVPGSTPDDGAAGQGGDVAQPGGSPQDAAPTMWEQQGGWGQPPVQSQPTQQSQPAQAAQPTAEQHNPWVQPQQQSQPVWDQTSSWNSEHGAAAGSAAPGSAPAGASFGVPPGQPPLGGHNAPSGPPSSGPATTGAARKQRRAVGTGTIVACTLIAAVIGGGIGAGAVAMGGGDQAVVSQSNSSATDGASRNAQTASAQTGTVAAAAAKASPSVVTLSVSGADSAGSGSGIVLDDEGHVLTNTHVVTLGGQTSDPEISVRLDDGTVTSATVVGTDPLSDLAVIKLTDTDGLVPAELGSSADLLAGDQTIAIGAPLGLDGTVTSGIVSAQDRTISVASSQAPDQESDGATPNPGDEFEFFGPGQQSGNGRIYINVIQTDASINQGNSGGALVNGDGQIIGINVAIASVGNSESGAGSIGVGFAIPIDYASRVADDLIANGEVTHGFLGVQVLGAGAQGQSDGQAVSGAVIDSVVEGQPADRAGLQADDVITAVDGRPVTDSASLTATVREYRPGDEVTVTYLRGGDEQQAQVSVEAMPQA